MIKYQYQTLSTTFESLEETLNDRGNRGWKLVSIVHKETKVSAHTTKYSYECVFEKIIM